MKKTITKLDENIYEVIVETMIAAIHRVTIDNDSLIILNEKIYLQKN